MKKYNIKDTDMELDAIVLSFERLIKLFTHLCGDKLVDATRTAATHMLNACESKENLMTYCSEELNILEERYKKTEKMVYKKLSKLQGDKK